MTNDELKKIFKTSISKADAARKMGYTFYNGRISKIINVLIEINNIDISHFIPNGNIPK